METVGPYRLDALVGRGTTGAVWRATRLGGLAHVVAVKRARARAAGPDSAGNIAGERASGAGGIAGERASGAGGIAGERASGAGRIAGERASGAGGIAERLRREAAILAELDHPHIVRVVDVLDDGDGVAIVMSLARGGSLHDLLVERARLTAGQTVAVLSRIADALGSAHRRGVLHGDVKPANILFTSDGEPLLGDFGVAQHLLPGLPGMADGATRSAVEGTTGYVDPELVATGVPTPQGDVYGLGVVAYLCLTGRLPHAGPDTTAVLAAADAGDHPPLADAPGVPPALAAVVEAALARQPSDRPATAEDLAARLRAAVPSDEVVLPGTPLAAHDDPEVDGADADEHDDDEHDDDGADRPATPQGTRAFGRQPVRTPAAPDRGHPLLTLVAVLAVLAVAVGGGLWVRDRLDAEQAPGAVEVAGGATPDAVACPDLEPIDVPPGAEELEGDLNGDGCPVPVVWNGQVMRFRLDEGDVEPRSYDFRQSGDRAPGQLLLGDWDCDGADTPALYRPGTGVVAYFDTVPGRVGGTVTATNDPTGVTGGRARLAEGGDCGDTVEVAPAA